MSFITFNLDVPLLYTEAFNRLNEYCDQLEDHYKDMMDIEFTVECGRLFILQCRSGKRTGRGALRIAVEMVKEGQVTEPRALCMIEPRHVDQMLHPCFDSKVSYADNVVASGLPASPGAAVGQIVFTAKEAEAGLSSTRSSFFHFHFHFYYIYF